MPRPVKGQQPPNGNLNGHSKAKARAIRGLSATIREGMDPMVYFEFFTAVAKGQAANLDEDEDGIYVTYEAKGAILPTLQQRIDAMRWLADRGYGMPVQSVQLDQQIRIDASQTNLPRGTLDVQDMIGFREVLSRSRSRLAGQHQPALDAASTETPDGSASDDHADDGVPVPASTTHPPDDE